MILIRTIIVLTAALCHLASANAQDLESDMPDLENVEVESFGLALKGAIECRRSIGLAGGILDISGSWEFVGQGPVALTGSPILSMTCDAGGDRVAASFGISSAPFYVQRTNSNAIVEEFLTLSGGVLLGNQTWRYGAMGSIGYGYFGLGLRGLWLPWKTRMGIGRGLEVRVMTWFAGKVGAQVSVRFHLTAQKRQLRRKGKQ